MLNFKVVGVACVLSSTVEQLNSGESSYNPTRRFGPCKLQDSLEFFKSISNRLRYLTGFVRQLYW